MPLKIVPYLCQIVVLAVIRGYFLFIRIKLDYWDCSEVNLESLTQLKGSLQYIDTVENGGKKGKTKKKSVLCSYSGSFIL